MKALLFSPPDVDPPPELRWVLHRAFANPEIPVSPPLDPEAALGLARQFDLAARIGASTPAGTVKAEAGPAADGISRALHLTVVNTLRYEATLRLVGELAVSRGIPLVILKGSAIVLLGLGATGARSFSDLDILVPTDRIIELRTALVDAGWNLSLLPASEHQEAPLTHRSLGTIELHRCIPGVRPPGSRRSFDARALLEAGLTEALPGFGGTIQAPERTILIAHALVHGLVQHGNSPSSYPLFRFLTDLQDLGAAEGLLREAGRFLRDLDSGDLEAITVLLEALASGTALDLPAGPSRALLSHIVAGGLHADYMLSLKTDPRALRSPSDLPLPLSAMRLAVKMTFLTRAQVDGIYGPPKRLGGYAARQLLRPSDLALRFVRSSAARRRLRFPKS